MRVYTPADGDTLHSIACKKYYVYNDQGDEDACRVATVIREIIKRNPCVSKLFGVDQAPISIEGDVLPASWGNTLKSPAPVSSRAFAERLWRQHGPQIVLPSVPGIPPYEATQGSGQRQKWFYAVLWFLGIVVGMGFYLAQQYLIQQPGGALFQDLPSWLETQALGYILSPSTLLSAILPRVVLWSLAVWAAWLFFRPVASSPVLHIRLRYFVGWVIGLIALIPGLYVLINIVVPSAAPALSQFADLFPLLVLWTILMFLLYLYLGDGSELHQDYLVPYQGIWSVLALILLGTVLAGYSGYQQVSQRIQGELSTLTLAQATVQQLHGSTHKLIEAVAGIAQKKLVGNMTGANQQERDNADDYISYEMIKWPEIRQHIDSIAMQSADSQAAVRSAIAHFEGQRREIDQMQGKNNSGIHIAGLTLPAMTFAGQTTLYTATEIYTDTSYISEQIDALGQISSIITPTLVNASALTQKADQIQAILTSSSLPVSTKAYSTGLLINTDLLRLAYDADLKAAVADSALSGTKFDGLPLFLWNGVFMAVLVLFPWLLLMLFLYRKRVNLSAQIYADLIRLAPNGRLLRRVLGGSNSQYERKVKRETLANGASPAPKADPAPAQPSGSKQASGDDARGDQQSQSENELIELLAARTFSSFEYLICLIFLSLLIAVGWYYVFYPQTSIGLTKLIERGAGVRQLTGFITANLTPLTMGFAGAYFFLMQMLVRRYLSDDLYPSAFLQSVQRLLLVFMLSLALTILTVRAPSELFTSEIKTWEGLVITIAFLVGIYPTSGLQLLITLVNRQLRHAFFPPTLVPEPITKLSGVTIWIEARLLEENIESIEAMATAPIERLVVGTHFPPAQIVDWIDQAILYLHSGHNGEWFSQLRGVGVRGASDLLDVTGLNLADPRTSLYRDAPDQSDRGDFVPSELLLNRLVEAVRSANASGVPEPDPNDPRGMARITVDQLVSLMDTAAKAAGRVHTLVATIDPKNAETFETVQLINTDVARANAFIAAASEPLTSVLGTSDQEYRLRDACAALKATAEIAAKLTASYAPISASSSTQPITLVKAEQLAQMKVYITNLHNLLGDIELQLHKIVHLAGPLASGESASAQAQELQKQAQALIEQRAQAQTALDAARTRAERINPAEQATLDAREDLKGQAHALAEQAAGLKQQLAAVENALMGDDITKTRAQQQTVRPALDDAKNAVDALQQPAIQASIYAEDLLPQSPLSPARIVPSKDRVQEIDKLFTAAQSQIKGLSAAAGTITAPPQLTAAIVGEMCDAIWPSPNLPFILNFYQQSCDDVEPKHHDTRPRAPGDADKHSH